MEFASAEVVPATLRADLDDVTVELGVFASQLVQLAGLGQRPPVGRSESVSVHVGHVEEVLAPTHRTVLADPLADVARRAQQFWVRITDVVATHATGAQIAQDRPAGE